MKLKLKDYYKSILLEGQMDEYSKQQVQEDIRSFGSFGEHIYNSRGMAEVAESVKDLAERASAMALDEAGDWFDAVTVKKNMNEVKKDAVLFEKTAKEMGSLQQRLESLYEDMAQKLGRYYEVGELSGKQVLPADNDYTANGEEEEEENNENYQYMGDLQYRPGENFNENFKMDTGKQPFSKPGNAGGATPGMGGGGAGITPPVGPGGMSATNSTPNPGAATLPLGDLMSDEEIHNVKENYWTLQGAQKQLMEDEEGVTADEGAPGIAVNKSTEWKARNESRANYFARMKEILERQ